MLLKAKSFDFFTENLHIKPLTSADEPLYVELYTSERVMRFITAPLTPQQAKASFDYALTQNQIATGKRLFLTTRPKEAEHAVALCCISDFDREKKVIEIGNIVSPQAQGKQYAQEATIALMSHIQKILDVHHFTMDIHPKNLPALRAARILGYKPVEGKENAFFLCRQDDVF